MFRRKLVAIGCAILLLPGEGVLLAQGMAPASAPAAEPAATKLPPEQLDSLVAPIALYPDPLLAQTLVASTYPLELIQLQQWLAKNPNLKDKALADAVAKQPWDPAIQSMAAVPEVVKRLADDLQWTTDLGNAFLEQQSDVMDAVQRMRKKAKDTGALVSNEQQKVETTVVEQKTVIVVQQANPEVIYVPSYSPVVVYGPPVYAYPPIYYPPPPPPGAAFMTFAVGVAIGAAFWGGSCCGCGWGSSNNVNINVNNNFNRNTNINGGGGGGNNNWQHNSQHRGAAPYSSSSTANKYGGAAKGQSPSAKQQPSGGSAKGQSPSAKQQPSGGSAKGQSPSAKQQPSGGGGAFGGGSGGYSGSSAKSSSSRGSSSMGSRSGGSRGGGGGRR